LRGSVGRSNRESAGLRRGSCWRGVSILPNSHVLGQAPVEDQGLAVGTQHDIGRLNVPVHDAPAMRIGDGVANRNESIQQLPQVMGGEKGVRHLLPERPEGCCAQKVPDPFFAAMMTFASSVALALGGVKLLDRFLESLPLA